MSDPLGMLGSSGASGAPGVGAADALGRAQRTGASDGSRFEQELLSEISRQIDEADRLQGDADVAAQDLATGVRSDVEGVMIATQKADTAFRMLLAVRNRMMEAYEEVKQIRI